MEICLWNFIDENVLWKRILRSFSILRNFKALNRYSPEKTYTLVYFIKVLGAFTVITGHRFLYFFVYPPIVNAEQLEVEMWKISQLDFLLYNSVDIFLVVNGYLMYHHSKGPIQKGGFVYLLTYILFVWLRMIALPALLILIVLNISPIIKLNGPFMDFFMTNEGEVCESNWWLTLLAINNIVRPNRVCLRNTWYLSIQIQLTIIGGMWLYVMVKNKKIGILLTVFTAVLCSVKLYAVTYQSGFSGLQVATLDFLKNPYLSTNVESQIMLYISTYSRMGPYFLGFIAACLTEHFRSIKYNFDPKVSALILVLSITFGTKFALHVFRINDPGRPFDTVANALHMALYRAVFMFPLAYVLCIYFTSGLGRLNRLMEHTIFVFLGRLLNSVYCVGPILQAFLIFPQQTYMMPSNGRLTIYWWATADIIWVFFTAFLVYLTAEAPMNNIIKLLEQSLIRQMKRPAETKPLSTASISTISK